MAQRLSAFGRLNAPLRRLLRHIGQACSRMAGSGRARGMMPAQTPCYHFEALELYLILVEKGIGGDHEPAFVDGHLASPRICSHSGALPCPGARRTRPRST